MSESFSGSHDEIQVPKKRRGRKPGVPGEPKRVLPSGDVRPIIEETTTMLTKAIEMINRCLEQADWPEMRLSVANSYKSRTVGIWKNAQRIHANLFKDDVTAKAKAERIRLKLQQLQEQLEMLEQAEESE